MSKHRIQIGSTPSGNPVSISVNEMRKHMIMLGAIGSGKTNMANAINRRLSIKLSGSHKSLNVGCKNAE